jgi:predicted Zn-dependent peptidase
LPEEELTIFKTQRIQQLQMSLQKGDFVANRQIDESIYGASHPYGRKSSVADYEALQITACIEFYKKYYQTNTFKIFVGGKIPANTVSLLNQYFGQHKTSSIAQIPVFDVQTTSNKKIEIINDANAVQGAIRIARPFYNRHHPDFMEALVLNTIFGGYFGSRLMTNIREDKGYTYGIHSYVQNHLLSTAWIIATETGKEVTPAAITEIYNEMQNMCSTLVDAEELQLVRNYMIGQLLGDLEGPFHLVNRWKTYIHNGVDENYFYTYLNKIRNITPERIQQLAQQYFTKNDFIELVVY